MVAHAANQWPLEDLQPKIASEVDRLLPHLVERHTQDQDLRAEVPFITSAVENYRREDYLGSISVLYPRIEGSMRRNHWRVEPGSMLPQGRLVDSAVSSVDHPGTSPLLPHRFARFLKEVYFANFDPRDPAILSRHSVSHGTAPAEVFTQQGALLSFLIVDQLYYYFRREE